MKWGNPHACPYRISSESSIPKSLAFFWYSSSTETLYMFTWMDTLHHILYGFGRCEICETWGRKQDTAIQTWRNTGEEKYERG